MITYFPEIYEDELFYSVIARLNNHLGYINFSNCFGQMVSILLNGIL